MSRRTRGQSLVEMAFMLPLLLVLLFGIIEFGWLIFAYSTVSQATRNAAETAAQLPPHQSWIDLSKTGAPGYPGLRADDCMNSIFTAVERDTTVIGSSESELVNYVTISYPNGPNSRNLQQRGPIEVTIRYPVRGLTPLFNLVGIGDGSGTVTLQVTQRRSLQNLGADPTNVKGVACARDVQDWKDLNKNP